MAEKAKTYYAVGVSRFSVQIPVLDEAGKPIQEEYRGTKIYNVDGKPVYRSRSINFNKLPVAIVGGAEHKAAIYSTSDDREIALLDSRAADPASNVQGEEEYTRSLNPAAYAERKEATKAKRDLSAAKDENTRLTNIIEEQKRQLAEMAKQRK